MTRSRLFLQCASLFAGMTVWHTSALAQSAERFPYQPGIDVSAYAFRIALPERGREITGRASITLDRRRSVDTLRLDLLAPMQVDRVRIGGRPRAIRRDSAQLHIPLRPSDGRTLRVVIDWHGTPTDGLIITEPTAGPDDRGWRAFGDNWPNRARHWLPTVDHPSDKATVQWTIDAPASLAVVANGVRTARTMANDRTVWRFAMRQPIPTYLMVLGAARMVETSLGRTACGHGIDGGCVPQSVWTFPEERTYVPGPFQEADAIVRFFSQTATGFPYPRLAHLQSSTRFGGMENATAIFYSDRAFRDHDVGVSLIAHETAHQWFGNAVTPRRWEDVWLSEGFATYWAALYTRASRGDSAYRADLRRIREKLLAAKEVRERPVVDTVGARTPLTLLNRNSYEKGGFFLRMLHAELGDSAFFRGIRAYQRRYRHGTAITSEFRQVMERAGGRSLESFFAQWLYRPGAAALTVRWRYDSARAAVVVRVEQPEGTAYDLPLDLVIRGAQGAPVRQTLRVEARGATELVVPWTGSQPTGIEVDPEVRVLGTVTVGISGG